jgi:glycosyltransferase involved in cell wall biosynthesis
MGAQVMKKLKIGYWPLSQNLNSPGDRRRLVFWANSRGHEIIPDLSQYVDVIVASENSDFNSTYFAKRQTPVIFDLVDAYLSPLSTLDDLARGIAKRLSGQISGGIRPFSHHIRDFCLNSNAVICSSKEQEEVIQQYNSNTHVILDSHDEIPFIDALKTRSLNPGRHRILWEGQPATIRGVKTVSPALLELSKTFSLNLDFVTDEKYYRLLNKYFETNTSNLLNKDLSHIADFVNIIPWTSNNLVECAKGSEVAMIPIDLSVPMQRLKPENRLLIMWRLGLPCLTSPSPAYVRVAGHAGVTVACNSQQEWIDNFNRLLSDPEHAKREILAGQNYISENHNKTILLKKWDLAFESVVN